jgi:RecA/RadA recombinase
MAKKDEIKKEQTVINPYENIQKTRRFFSSGCTLFDIKALGGGYSLGRMCQIYGPESSNKTGLMTEAAANFHREFPNGKIYFQDAERAFDIPYGETLGLPIEAVEFVEDVFTISGFAAKISEITRGVKRKNKTATSEGSKEIKAIDKDIPKLYILDSLDALEATPESRSELQESGYSNARRAGDLSTFFRKLNACVEDSNMCLLIVSQIRDNVGVMYGERQIPSGGNAVKFYAAQRVKLAIKEKIKGPVFKGDQEIIGVRIKAINKKNKVGLPYRECIFPLYFNFGIKDYEANAEWLVERDPDLLDSIVGTTTKINKKTGKEEECSKKIKEIIQEIEENDDREMEARLREAVIKLDREMQNTWLPKRKKYV